MRFLVVVPCYNRPELLWPCLHSIANQDDDAFDVIVADDASTDPKVSEFMDEWASGHPAGIRWWSLRQPENVGAVRNIADAIRMVPEVEPDDVVFLVDGDDAIPPYALSAIRALYERDDVATNATYGSYESEPYDPDCPPAWRIPGWVLDSGHVREYLAEFGQAFNHPLTFRRWCFDRIRDHELMVDGEWMRYGYDMAYFVPILEMCGPTAWFCDQVVYRYTSNRAESVARAYPTETDRENRAVLSMGRQHDPIT